MRALAQRVQDNAMFYKDITQWLRNRTFLALFFGLLLVAEGISVFIMSLGETFNPGPAVFYSLYFVLVIYAIVIGFMAHGLTAREFANKTFELYELSGMSLERMISGKLISMVYQFLFGFFCIVPFMFFAYFLGGLDFFELFSGATITLFLILPLYLFTLLIALTTRLKQVSTLGRLFVVFGGIFFVLGGFIQIVTSRSPLAVAFRSASNMLKDLLQLNPQALVFFAAFLLFYVQVCLMLFYLCCNTISRESDSRELPIKALSYTLLLSWLGFVATMVYRNGHSGDVPGVTCLPVFFALCVLGVTLFYNRLEVPIIIRRKYEERKGLRHVPYYLFQPGAVGTYRTMLLMLGTLAVAAFGIFAIPTLRGVVVQHYDWIRAYSIALQVPFFLVFPLGFLVSLKSMKNNYTAQRTMVGIWWGVAGAVAGFFASWANMRTHMATPMFEFVALIVSPFSSAFTEMKAGMRETAPLVRGFLGVLGIYLMYRHLERRKRESGRVAVSAPTAAPPTVAEPSSPEPTPTT